MKHRNSPLATNSTPTPPETRIRLWNRQIFIFTTNTQTLSSLAFPRGQQVRDDAVCGMEWMERM
jgi:hypothetical protein